MSQEQKYELSDECKHYWSAENTANRYADISIRHLNWENEDLKKHVEKLTRQLDEANRRIRELTGEPEPVEEPEMIPIDINDPGYYPIVRSHCGWKSPDEEPAASAATADEEDQKVIDYFTYSDPDSLVTPMHQYCYGGDICSQILDFDAVCRQVELEQLEDPDEEDKVGCVPLERQYCQGTFQPIDDFETRIRDIEMELQGADSTFFGEFPEDCEALEEEGAENNFRVIGNDNNNNPIFVGNNSIRVCLDETDIPRHETPRTNFGV
jgi:hypothetical protein